MHKTSMLCGVLLVLCLGAGCGGDDDAGGCEGLCNKLCRLATDCISSSAQSDCCMQSGSTTQCRNPAGTGCEIGMVRDVCGDTTKTDALFTECAAALDQARCENNGSEDVLVLPAACDGLLECNSGPCLD